MVKFKATDAYTEADKTGVPEFNALFHFDLGEGIITLEHKGTAKDLEKQLTKYGEDGLTIHQQHNTGFVWYPASRFRQITVEIL